MSVIDDTTDLSHLPWRPAETVPVAVKACRMAEPFLLDARGCDAEEHGAGDYLVQYADGRLMGCSAADQPGVFQWADE
jgi:hypothetical protein